MKTLRSTGELALIERLKRLLPTRPDVVTGAGDDCAVVRGDTRQDWLLKSDPVIEGVHFLPGDPPEWIGHKAAGRVLSDLAAMGGEPRWALVDVVAPARTPVRRVEGAYRGIRARARKHGLAVVGGDVSRGPVFELHVFAVGAVPRGKAVLRSGARPCDLLFVTGELGGSRAGKHLRFAPRVDEGRFLRDWATAMIDVSDGLASDLRHVVKASGVGVSLLSDRIPISRAARTRSDRRSPLDHALYDGEDFELLFTIPQRKEPAFLYEWGRRFDLPCEWIGVVTPRRGVIGFADLKRRLTRTGFQHFG